MKLWHDDIRRPPDDSWTWARTNAMAEMYLSLDHVDVISLDHDLGLEGEDPDDPNAWLRIGPCTDGTGMDLVDWMIEEDLVPPVVIVHSLNPGRSKAMLMTIAAAYNREIISTDPLKVYQIPYSLDHAEKIAGIV